MERDFVAPVQISILSVSMTMYQRAIAYAEQDISGSIMKKMLGVKLKLVEIPTSPFDSNGENSCSFVFQIV